MEMSIGFGFWLKKVISFWLMPLPIGILLGVIGLWFLFRSNLRLAKRFLITALIWFALVTYAPIGNLLLKPLESQYSKLETVPNNVHYILLLGGDREHRAWEAIRLYRQIDDAKIITSGYSRYDKLSDAKKTAKILQEAGVSSEDILLQSKAKDTQEEAYAIKKRLGDAPFLLVTSAYHMPRSMKIFKKAGLKPIAAPGDFNNPDENGLITIFTGKQLRKTEKAMHEYIGLLWLELKSLL